MGYARVPTVTEVAQCSVRGGILDVYGFGMAAPARVEWWGDEILSLRTFDLDTQRSGEPVERVTVLPVKSEGTGKGEGEDLRRSLLELLPSDAVVVLDQESALGRRASAPGPTPPIISKWPGVWGGNPPAARGCCSRPP